MSAKINFQLGWMRRDIPLRRAFKLEGTGELFETYRKRLKPFAEIKVTPVSSERQEAAEVWFCEIKEKGAISSEKLAKKLENHLEGAKRSIVIVIGGADGLTPAMRSTLKPDFTWTFGPMTLPHELAAVVAIEQIYRAASLINNHPYHVGH